MQNARFRRHAESMSHFYIVIAVAPAYLRALMLLIVVVSGYTKNRRRVRPRQVALAELEENNEAQFQIYHGKFGRCDLDDGYRYRKIPMSAVSL